MNRISSFGVIAAAVSHH